MKKLILTLAFVVTPVLASVPAHADVTIGLVGPFTGPLAKGGEQIQRGVEQAVADINAAGGIKGEKIILRKADDACDPKQAVAAANQLVSAGVKFIVGHYCSSAAIPASKVYMEEGALLITPGASNPKLTDEGKDLIFRAFGRDDKQGALVGSYMLKHYADKKIAIVHDQSAWGRGLADELAKTIHAGGLHEILFDAITPGQRDYGAIVSKLKEIGADVVFLGCYDTESGLIVRQLHEQGAKMQVMGGDALTSGQFWPITGAAGEGMLMSFAPEARNKPEAKDAIASLRKTGYEPEGDTLYAYAAMQVVAKAIERAGKDDPLKVAAAIRQSPTPTILGALSFDAKGDLMGDTFTMYRWHDGTYTEIAK